jgi:protocatechuate 4,5-dioxygenase alpha chain
MAIPGTPIFDGAAARKGYALNKMCYSLNSAENRAEFLRDEEAYCRKFGLDPAQREAVRRRKVADLIAAGGNVYYLEGSLKQSSPRRRGPRLLFTIGL